jgi:ribosomal protein S12 methylthiotransferase
LWQRGAFPPDDFDAGVGLECLGDRFGKELPVLLEGPSQESELLLQGRLESQAPEIDGVCLINDSETDRLNPGEFRVVRISQALEHDLLGTIVR